MARPTVLGGDSHDEREPKTYDELTKLIAEALNAIPDSPKVDPNKLALFAHGSPPIDGRWSLSWHDGEVDQHFIDRNQHVITGLQRKYKYV